MVFMTGLPFQPASIGTPIGKPAMAGAALKAGATAPPAGGGGTFGAAAPQMAGGMMGGAAAGSAGAMGGGVASPAMAGAARPAMPSSTGMRMQTNFADGGVVGGGKTAAQRDMHKKSNSKKGR